jgi:DNA-binding beta-propeller fold protein YncE
MGDGEKVLVADNSGAELSQLTLTNIHLVPTGSALVVVQIHTRPNTIRIDREHFRKHPDSI